jgi:hypothetical protein
VQGKRWAFLSIGEPTREDAERMRAYWQSRRWFLRPRQLFIWLSIFWLYWTVIMVLGIIHGDPRLWSPILLVCATGYALVNGAIKQYKIKRALR